MSSEVEEVKSKLNVVDILSEYIRLEKAGANWRARCPFHNEKTPSFMVSEEKQMWHCFGCGKGGDIFGFVMEMEGLGFREALKMLAEKAGVQIKTFNPQKIEKQNRIMEILEWATKFWETQLWKGSGKDKILNYLYERGLKDETIKEFRLGYAPQGWRNILAFLTGKGYEVGEIARAGILVEKKENSINKNKASNRFYDRFRERIIFPIADYTGKVVGFSARVAPDGDEKQAKYINTPETEVYHKSRILYGMDKAKSEIKKKDWILLVEGNMDVIAAYQAGIKNSVAVSGTALTEEQIRMIKRYTQHIKMFFDMDKAGEVATEKSIQICLAQEMEVQVVSLPFGKDAADIAKENPAELRKTVVQSLGVMEYFFQKILAQLDKKKVEDKKKIARELLKKIASLENAVEKNYWLEKLSEELKTPVTALTDELKKISLKSRVGSDKIEEKIEIKRAGSKLDVLMEELIGLMLVFPIVWKKAVREIKKGVALPSEELLVLMLKTGAKNDFNFDKFVSSLGDRQKLRAKVEKIFFKNKYQLDLNNKLEEIEIEEPVKNFKNCFREIQKEIQKDNLIKLTQDLKTAEEKKDQSAILFLRQEFDRTSKKLKELNQ